jgi:hypothetical protein
MIALWNEFTVVVDWVVKVSFLSKYYVWRVKTCRHKKIQPDETNLGDASQLEPPWENEPHVHA